MEQRAGTGPELRAAGKAGAPPIATGDLLVANQGYAPESAQTPSRPNRTLVYRLKRNPVR